eukprot:1146249-Pelagomonas_calceolata.AAC.1
MSFTSAQNDVQDEPFICRSTQHCSAVTACSFQMYTPPGYYPPSPRCTYIKKAGCVSDRAAHNFTVAQRKLMLFNSSNY